MPKHSPAITAQSNSKSQTVRSDSSPQSELPAGLPVLKHFHLRLEAQGTRNQELIYYRHMILITVYTDFFPEFLRLPPEVGQAVLLRSVTCPSWLCFSGK